MAIFRAILVFLILGFSPALMAVEILSSPMTTDFGIGMGMRAENRYSDMQPAFYPAFSLSGDVTWRRFQALMEWSRWSERSSAGDLSVNHSQDIYTLIGRVEVLREDWLGLFFGAGFGSQQDRTETNFASQSEVATGNLDAYYTGEAGLSFYFGPSIQAQLSGRLMSQPHDSRWTQWISFRLAYQVF